MDCLSNSDHAPAHSSVEIDTYLWEAIQLLDLLYFVASQIQHSKLLHLIGFSVL